MSSKSAKVTLKLLIDKKTNRVLYGEAGKDFVDFLCTILLMPLGTATKLLSKDDMVMVGTLDNLYRSIEDLSDTYMQPKQLKNRVLNPGLLHLPPRVSHLLCNEGFPATIELYRCPSSQCRRVTDYLLAKCPSCKRVIIDPIDIVDPAATNEGAKDEKGEVGGFVKSAVAYMVMDNLEVKPISSSMSIMTLFNKLNIKNVGSIEEKVIPLGLAEGLSLLKASLETESVLTTVFLGDD